MVSMHCLGNASPVPMRVRIPSSIARTSLGTNCHFRLSWKSGSPSNGFRGCSIRHVFRPVIRAMEGSSLPSKKDKDNDRSSRGMGKASLVLACAIGIISACSFRMNLKAIAGPREMSQKAPVRVVSPAFDGRNALESLLDVPVYLTSSETEEPEKYFSLPHRPSIEEVNSIKMQAVQLMKYGDAEDAEKFLREAYNYYKHDPEPAYNVEMALVEVLICTGKYDEALERNCMDENNRLLPDARFPLYKAIIHTMLDEKEEAKKWWEEYMGFVEGGFDPYRM